MFKLVVHLTNKQVQVFEHVRTLNLTPEVVTLTYWDEQRLSTQLLVWLATDVASMRSDG